MKAFLFLSTIFIILSSVTFSQESSDKLTVGRITSKLLRDARRGDDPNYSTFSYSDKYLGFQVYKNGIPLDPWAAESIIKINTDAYFNFEKAKEKVDKYRGMDKKLMPVIVLLIVVPTACKLTGLNTLAMISTGVLAIPFFVGFAMGLTNYYQAYKLGVQAINDYNRGLRTTSKLPQPSLSIGLSGNGIGMRINF